MKKSEPIRVIANFLYERGVEAEDADNEATVLLDKLLALGMLPPETLFEPTHRGCLCTMRESCPSCGGYCNEWEKE